jgi:putative copper resistance protein D
VIDEGGILIGARAAFLAAAMATFGSALFPFYAVGRDDREQLERRTRPLVFGAALLALLSALIWLALVIVEFGGTDAASFVSTSKTILFETDFGPVWLVRLAFALLLVLFAASRISTVATLALATVVLASQAWVGHAAIGGTTHRVVQIAHLLPAGAWLGGLLPLALALRQVTQETADRGRALGILMHFSAIGIVSVAIITITGILNTWLVIGRIPTIYDEYDRILIVKIVLFIVILALAVLNRFHLLPKLRDPGGGGIIFRLLWWSVLLEQTIGVSIILAASIMGQTSPQS